MPRKKTVKNKKTHQFHPRQLLTIVSRVWRRNIWNKIWISLSVVVMLFVGTAYGVAQWYIWQNRDEPYRFGATFISDYAKYLGVDPQETLQAIIDDLQPTQLRLVSYWKHIEATQGTYDFSDLDWQVAMAEKHNIKVTLATGLRQPRWPECHMPSWALNTDKSYWYPQLKAFMKATIERYKNHPMLESWQLENEYFLSVFGECPDFSRDRLIDEYNLVKQLDPNHKVIISRSNNAMGFPINEPTPDEFGVTIYKRVWDKTITKRYIEYPFPGWFYAYLAGGGKLLTGKDLIVHELQAEAWAPEGMDMITAPTSELYKSMNPERLANRFEYAKASGMKHIDLWGVEWWYAMKINRGEPGLWEQGIKEFEKARTHNAKLKSR